MKIPPMSSMMSLPPSGKGLLTPPKKLAQTLEILIGHSFPLTYKSRTDGSNVRKLVAKTLEDNDLPVPARKSDVQVVPFKGKGVPKILLEYVDTYIVTSGKTYNLQVWNRNPASESVQLQYSNGDTLVSNEVRFVFVKINPHSEVIDSIVVLSPAYIVERFGQFGKPTVKYQLIISQKMRDYVLRQSNSILFYDDLETGDSENLSNLAD